MHKYTEKTVRNSTYKNVINCERNKIGPEGGVRWVKYGKARYDSYFIPQYFSILSFSFINDINYCIVSVILKWKIKDSTDT